MTADALVFEGVSRTWPRGGGLKRLDLKVAPGEIAVVVGPSGCGKSTTLRLAAGLLRPDAGRILQGGRDVTAAPPEARGLGVVFQHYALFPHLDAAGNVAYGLKARGVRGDELRRRVAAALEAVRLGDKGARRLDELSGGEQQRVALARAVVIEPPLLLLDEPLSNLDAELRKSTRDELRALLKRLGRAALYVTHDQEEALALADVLHVLRAGERVQSGPPEEVYARPATAFVARFLGGAEVLRGAVTAPGVAEAHEARFAVDPAAPRGACDLAVRPETVRLRVGDDGGATGGTPVRVVARTFAGGDVRLRLAWDGASLVARVRLD
ncbi:MAG TPA: ABC transporter ATP-binding protein, partial [Planctomycetota bacterium]|nr:ABC transporter ATP-binding protein [Planctomycetota bacterium]